jgi:beta-lactamase class A
VSTRGNGVVAAALCILFGMPGRPASAQAAGPALDSLRNSIVERIAATPGAISGVAFIDLQTGEQLALNDDSVFHAASTMKIPVMIEVLRRSQAGAFTLDQPVLLINSFKSLADGSRFSLEPADDGDSSLYQRVGQRVPVSELMRLMITRSSNLATNQLIELVGAAHITQGAHTLGATGIQVLRGVQDLKAFDAGLVNTTTARALATLLNEIERGRILSPASSAMMRDVLLAQEFNDKIPAGLPPGTRVAHKTGEITAVSHDAAIVYPTGRKPYVLVVLTRGVQDGKASAALIADISRLVWSHVTRNQ